MEASGRRIKGIKPGQTPAQSRSMDPEENLRIEVLRQQREFERRLRERAVWRKASHVPSTFGEDVSGKKQTSASTPPPHAGPKLSGFFEKIRLGRLLER
jgi:hypothetical protein